jgi:hypothetical protein
MQFIPLRAICPLLLVGMATARLEAQVSRPGRVSTCSEASLVEPGFGASYRGTVTNDDYKLVLSIPDGLTGWGADPIAPFHGFTIFLSAEDRSTCIVFEIHLRVELSPPKNNRRGTPVVIGGVPALKQIVAGTVNRVEYPLRSDSARIRIHLVLNRVR